MEGEIPRDAFRQVIIVKKVFPGKIMTAQIRRLTATCGMGRSERGGWLAI